MRRVRECASTRTLLASRAAASCFRADLQCGSSNAQSWTSKAVCESATVSRLAARVTLIHQPPLLPPASRSTSTATRRNASPRPDPTATECLWSCAWLIDLPADAAAPRASKKARPAPVSSCLTSTAARDRSKPRAPTFASTRRPSSRPTARVSSCGRGARNRHSVHPSVPR